MSCKIKEVGACTEGVFSLSVDDSILCKRNFCIDVRCIRNQFNIAIRFQRISPGLIRIGSDLEAVTGVEPFRFAQLGFRIVNRRFAIGQRRISVTTNTRFYNGFARLMTS